MQLRESKGLTPRSDLERTLGYGGRMKLVRFWSRAHLDTHGREDPGGAAIAFGWSDIDLAHARAHAIERAKRIAAILRAYDGGDRKVLHDLRDTFEYTYTDGARPIREPIVERVEHHDELEAVITRNAYGAYVLNTASVMFVDIDDDPPVELGFWARLFGVKPRPTPPTTTYEEIRGRFEAQQRLGARIYRTHSGHRALVTNTTFDPTAESTLDLLRTLGAVLRSGMFSCPPDREAVAARSPWTADALLPVGRRSGAQGSLRCVGPHVRDAAARARGVSSARHGGRDADRSRGTAHRRSPRSMVHRRGRARVIQPADVDRSRPPRK